MKILQITSYPPPRAGWGVRVQFLKRHLEAQGHQCVVLNTGRSRRIPSDEYETVLGAADYLRKVWRFAREGFLCHVHVNGKSPKGLVLALVAEGVNLLCGARCVLTFHAGEEQTYFPLRNAPWFAPVFWVLFAIPRTIICNNEAVKARIADYGIPRDKIVPIPAFSRQYLEFERAHLGEPVEAFYARFPSVLFCYLNLQPAYYPEVLLDAFERLALERPDVGLVLCGLMGHGEDRLAHAVMRRTGAPPLAGRVCPVDDLDHDQFLTALTRAAVYVRTPPTDGVSSSVLEALALGVPVVAADNGARPEGVVGYEATSADGLVDALRRVLSHRESVVAAIEPPVIADTLADEAKVLTT